MSGSRLGSDDGETPIAPAELPYAQSLLASMREAGRPAPLSVAQTLWPVDLAMLSHKPVQLGVPQEVAERPILVIGCSLGNHMAEVPKFVLQHFVTVVLRVYAGGKLRYGYSECEYVRGHSCTWEGAVDPAPVQQFSELIRRLLALGCAPRVAFVGISAGVHKILAAMSDMRVRDDVQVSHVIACAGAWHPGLFGKAWECPAAQQARWFCQHHVKDTLCRWPYELSQWWQARQRQQEHRVYVRALGDANPLLFGCNQHNTSGPLLSQKAFWQELQNPSGNFRSTCVNKQLGLGHLATDIDTLIPGYDSTDHSLDAAHALGLAFVAGCAWDGVIAMCSSMQKRWDVVDPVFLVLGLVVMMHHVLDATYIARLEELIRSLPALSCVHTTLLSLLPTMLSEAILAAAAGPRGSHTTLVSKRQTIPGQEPPDRCHNSRSPIPPEPMPVLIKCLQRLGPVCIVEVRPDCWAQPLSGPSRHS